MSDYCMSDVTIIVPCRNEEQYVLPFYDCVKNFIGYSEFRVIIADGMSTDGTRELLSYIQQNDTKFEVIDNEELIVSTALNAALRKCQTRLVIRLDMHSIYAEDYIREIVRAFNSAPSEVACVGGAWRPRAKRHDLVAEMISVAFENSVAAGGARSRSRDYHGVVDTVYLGAWRRDELIAIGGFDINLVRNQDDELCLRFRRQGKMIFQSSSIVSYYEPRSSLTKLARQYYQYGFWKVAVLRKHKEFGAPRHWLMFFAPYILSIIVLFDYKLVISGLVIYIVALLVGSLRIKGAGAAVKILSSVPIVIMHVAYGMGLQAALYGFGKPMSLSR